MKIERSPEENQLTQITVALPQHIVKALQKMEQNTKRPVDELIKTSLLMFIATHNDFLGVNRNK